VFQFTDLRELLALYLTAAQVESISQAYLLAADAHEGQKRVSGEPYITHPVEVARILANMRMDYETIAAAILHDVLEDTPMTKESLVEKFGEKIPELVDGVSKLTQINFENKELAQAESFRKMMLAMAKDIRVIIIKLADRLHNMRTSTVLSNEKRRRKARETLEIYAPIAHRLGMNQMRVEFEELGFEALYPMRFRVLRESVKKARGNRKKVLATVDHSIRAVLDAHEVKGYAVWGREKHLYSLYRKMRRKRLSFSEVMDVYAFRIIVESVEDCYRVLGFVHSIHRPVGGRFKDYIAVSKPNGYQSLHTVVLGAHAIPIEIQIRTKEMENFAENGIAAHWLYKNKGALTNPAQLQTRKWLKGLFDIQKQTGSSLEFLENVKIDLHSGEVYIFTPLGHIFALPNGSTPIDFAYMVHTDLGNSCVGCKIDRRLAPLSTRLSSGQTVEIITSETGQPNPAWLSFVVTGKAASNIRHWLKNQQRSESQALGRRLLDAVLSANRVSFTEFSATQIAMLLKEVKVDTLENLLEEIGLGKKMAPIIARHLLDVRPKGEHVVNEADALPLAIKGTEGLIVTYAKCCYPIPGDMIVGFLSKGQGLGIHRESCPIVHKQHKNPHQIIHVQWQEALEGEFQVEINVQVINTRGVLAQLASTISDCNANIINVDVDERDRHINTISFVITVRNRAHLARIVRRLRGLSSATRIIRAKNLKSSRYYE
jgi:GTP diphosphokinase / guanosine-3',5'-bis(diphosphate) 3'-diphosphatase